jgi:peroxiredoxin
MNSKLLYKNEEQILVDDFMDIGYMAENVVVLSTCKEQTELKRNNEAKSMSMFVSFPSLSDFENEILRLDKFMSDIKVDINCYLLFDSYNVERVELERKLNIFKVFFDEEEEYGNMYGTKIEKGTLESKLTKALFLISKDGAVFYIDMPELIEKPLDMDRLHIALNKAYVAYTGVGCHG